MPTEFATPVQLLSRRLDVMTRTMLTLAALLSFSVSGWADGPKDQRKDAGQLRAARTSVTADGKDAVRRKIANPCSEFGPGFVQIEGSTTCTRLGGALGIGASSVLSR